MSKPRVNVTFPDSDVHAFIEREAAMTGESLGEYLRVAGLARAMFSYVRRAPGDIDRWQELYEAASRLEHDGDTLPSPQPSGRTVDGAGDRTRESMPSRRRRRGRKS